jgi:hypothetical protein
MLNEHLRAFDLCTQVPLMPSTVQTSQFSKDRLNCGDVIFWYQPPTADDRAEPVIKAALVEQVRDVFWLCSDESRYFRYDQVLHCARLSLVMVANVRPLQTEGLQKGWSQVKKCEERVNCDVLTSHNPYAGEVFDKRKKT